MALPRPVLVAALIAGVALPVLQSAHRHTDAWAPRASVAELSFYLPSPKLVRIGALGYEALLADLLWLRASTLFGDRYASADDDWYGWLYQMMDLATELDPEFRAVYKYGGIMLRADGVFVDQSNLIFSKGALHLPDEWFFPFGIAMNYFMHRDDRRTASIHMRRAAETNTGPFYLRNLAASLLSETEQMEEAQLFLREEFNNLQPGSSARRAVKVKLFELDYLIAVRDAKAVLDEHRRTTGNYPAEPQGVAAVGMALPADPLGGRWVYDRGPKTTAGTVKSSLFCDVFIELAEETGLGRVDIDVCPR